MFSMVSPSVFGKLRDISILFVMEASEVIGKWLHRIIGTNPGKFFMLSKAVTKEKTA
jgi:hypothetical protein